MFFYYPFCYPFYSASALSGQFIRCRNCVRAGRKGPFCAGLKGPIVYITGVAGPFLFDNAAINTSAYSVSPNPCFAISIVGAIVWGFVPIRDLKVMDQEKVPEAADQLIGMWKLEAGGSLADDCLAFSEDGTFTGNSVEWETGAVLQDDNSGKSTGTWYVTKYSPFMNLYWNKPPYQLTLIYNNGRVTMQGLEITEDGFSLTNDEGGGGYVPATEEDITLKDDHG